MKGKKFLLSFVLIGFLFNIFHDFVFYSTDPCMLKFETVIKFDEGKSNDPLCKIHHQLHQIYLNGINLNFHTKFEQTYSFSFKEIFLSLFQTSIFKPPKHLA